MRSKIGGQWRGEKGGGGRRDAPALAWPLKAPSIVMIFVGYIADGFSNVIEALRKLEGFILGNYKKVELKARCRDRIKRRFRRR